MKGTIKRCDQCGNEESRFSNTFGGLGWNWITVTRNTSMSQDKIRAGESDFCTEKCLRDHLAGEKATERKDPAPNYKIPLGGASLL